MKDLLIRLKKVLDPCLALALIPTSFLMLFVRRYGISNLPLCQKVFYRMGVFPIHRHYYEPLFHPDDLKKPLALDRELPGIEWNEKEQIELLSQFNFTDELLRLPVDASDKKKFGYHNGSFESGDAEIWYNLIRHLKPKKIIEIGSGNSTLLAVEAVRKNKEENHLCEHICIEPYEFTWLEELGSIRVLRQKVEDVDQNVFLSLSPGDILFIDSSHMIRPQGDVLFEYLELLPKLPAGVYIHIHDIFSPKDYLEEWVLKYTRFWNEQYLLEAFLSFNSSFKIIAALNFLKHHHPKEMAKACPVLATEMATREPGSFYIQKIK